MVPSYKSIFIEAKNVLHLKTVGQVLGQFKQAEVFEELPGMDKIYPKRNINSRDLAEYLGKYGITNYEMTIDELLSIIE